MELLNKYYGDARNENHKREICDFIESNYYEIKQIMENEGF